jgi:glucose/arabinose dehydrogenase
MEPVMKSALLCLSGLIAMTPATAPAQTKVLTGVAAYGDWRSDAPGVRRLIQANDLPPPHESRSASNGVSVVHRQGSLKAPNGFSVKPFAAGFENPRVLRLAPNGDIFVAETRAGRVRVLRPSANGDEVARNEVFASGLNRPFGIAFYPKDDPQWIYVANTNAVMRFPYRSGDLGARGQAETIVASLPTGGHSTRDIAFSSDGSKMFVSVGSASNVAEGLDRLTPDQLKKWTAEQPLGAIWGHEQDRADVLVFDPQGKGRRIYASGIRNCVGMAVEPATGDLWCSVNERDALGDDLPPEYITRVRDGAFYGWPWYYIGGHEDPRHRGGRLDLKDKVTVPDILIQPHSASMNMMFYTGDQFPAEYKGNAFAAQHGSWNRAKRTGYKIIRAIVKNGVPTGEYEDFVTGFVVDDASTWGRPVGIAQDKTGALLFSEDGNNTIWRVTFGDRRAAQ